MHSRLQSQSERLKAKLMYKAAAPADNAQTGDSAARPPARAVCCAHHASLGESPASHPESPPAHEVPSPTCVAAPDNNQYRTVNGTLIPTGALPVRVDDSPRRRRVPQPEHHPVPDAQQRRQNQTATYAQQTHRMYIQREAAWKETMKERLTAALQNLQAAKAIVHTNDPAPKATQPRTVFPPVPPFPRIPIPPSHPPPASSSAASSSASGMQRDDADCQIIEPKPTRDVPKAAEPTGHPKATQQIMMPLQTVHGKASAPMDPQAKQYLATLGQAMLNMAAEEPEPTPTSEPTPASTPAPATAAPTQDPQQVRAAGKYGAAGSKVPSSAYNFTPPPGWGEQARHDATMRSNTMDGDANFQPPQPPTPETIDTSGVSVNTYKAKLAETTDKAEDGMWGDPNALKDPKYAAGTRPGKRKWTNEEWAEWQGRNKGKKRARWSMTCILHSNNVILLAGTLRNATRLPFKMLTICIIPLAQEILRERMSHFHMLPPAEEAFFAEERPPAEEASC